MHATEAGAEAVGAGDVTAAGHVEFVEAAYNFGLGNGYVGVAVHHI